MPTPAFHGLHNRSTSFRTKKTAQPLRRLSTESHARIDDPAPAPSAHHDGIQIGSRTSASVGQHGNSQDKIAQRRHVSWRLAAESAEQSRRPGPIHHGIHVLVGERRRLKRASAKSPPARRPAPRPRADQNRIARHADQHSTPALTIG